MEYWGEIQSIRSEAELPWLVVGDFNEALTNNEKKGGCINPERQMDNFRQVLADCGLRDLNFVGAPFMWINGHEGEHLICECLDCCLANNSWWNLYPK